MSENLSPDSKVTKKNLGGRPRGSPNKRSLDVAARLAALGCHPLEAMARLAAEAEAEGDKALAGSMYKELAQYTAPKRKAVEVTGEGGGAIEQSVSVSIKIV